jgi:hypothetical protein
MGLFVDWTLYSIDQFVCSFIKTKQCVLITVHLRASSLLQWWFTFFTLSAMIDVLSFHINFRCLLITKKQLARILIRIELNL